MIQKLIPKETNLPDDGNHELLNTEKENPRLSVVLERLAKENNEILAVPGVRGLLRGLTNKVVMHALSNRIEKFRKTNGLLPIDEIFGGLKILLQYCHTAEINAHGKNEGRTLFNSPYTVNEETSIFHIFRTLLDYFKDMVAAYAQDKKSLNITQHLKDIFDTKKTNHISVQDLLALVKTDQTPAQLRKFN